MYFRAAKNGEEGGDYIKTDFKDPKTYKLMYHCVAVVAIGWPAHWMTKWAKKHSDWILTEYNIELFKKRLDDHENL